MNKVYLSILVMMISLAVKAQDFIYKNDKTEVKSKIVEIDDNVIKYKKWSNQNGPLYTISKREVFMIIYENGEKEIISTTSNTEVIPTEKVNSKELIDDKKDDRIDFTSLSKNEKKTLGKQILKNMDFNELSPSEINTSKFGFTFSKANKLFIIPPFFAGNNFYKSKSMSLGWEFTTGTGKRQDDLFETSTSIYNIYFNTNFYLPYIAPSSPSKLLKYDAWIGLNMGLNYSNTSYGNSTLALQYNLTSFSTIRFGYFLQFGACYFGGQKGRVGLQAVFNLARGGSNFGIGFIVRAPNAKYFNRKFK